MKKLKTIYKYSLLFAICSTCLDLAATPIDWNGAVGFDTTMLQNFRRIKSTTDNSTGRPGSQEVTYGGKDNSQFQAYLFRLNPVVIVNDSASVFGEFTTGYGRGGFMGDSSIQSKETDWGNALYLHNTTDTTKNSLNVTKLYTVLYSDAFTYTIGRHSKHWGLGTVMNNGENVWDHYSSIRDGITVDLKIGSFSIAPYWAKISSENSLTDSTKSKEYGVGVLYDNSEKELAFGALYNKKANALGNESFKTDVTYTGTADTAYNFGETNVKLIDIYFRKSFGPLNVGVEFPLVSGEIGNIYQNGQSTKYKAKAFITETEYNFNEAWKLGLNLGHVSGDPGSESSFEAMFLNPNYQIANIMFRYNMDAINNPETKSLYDSYITNAKFLKFGATYNVSKWTLNGAFIYAKANQAAKADQRSYNHTKNKIFNATLDQEDDLGFELDLNCTYKWSDEINIALLTGYHFTGDYYAYTNDSSIVNETANVFLGQLRVGISF